MHTERQLTTWKRPAAGVAFLMAVCASAAADNTYWQAGVGDWFVDAHWTAGVPSAGDTATVDNGGTARITSGSAVAADLIAGAGASGSVQQTGGVAQVSGRIYVAQGYGSAGAYDLSGPAELTAGDLHVGGRGAGAFSQAGATCTVNGQLYVAYGPTATGTYLLTGSGRLSADALLVGYQGVGAFIQTGGVTRVATDVYLGSAAGAFGRYDLTDGALSADTEFVGGWFGGGVFTHSAGVNAVDGVLMIGYGSEASGTYILNGPGLLTAGTVGVAATGRGTFIHTDGISTVKEVKIAPYSSAVGRYELGGDAELNAEVIKVGEVFEQSTASFLQTGGTVTVSGSLYLAGPASSYTLTGGVLTAANGAVKGRFHHSGGRLETGSVRVGGAEDHGASFRQTGGVHVAGSIHLGTWGRRGGTYDLGPAGELISGEVWVGVVGSGTFTQTGGVHTVGLLTVGDRYEFLGGTLTPAALDLHGVMDFGGQAISLDWGDACLELSQATIAGAAAVSLTIGDGSLLILAPGRDPTTAFQSFSTTGLVHTTGTTLVVPAGRDYVWAGHIDDHVRCEANLSAPPGTHLDLNAGLTVAAGMRVDLGTGALTVLDDISTMAGEALAAARINVGPTGPGRFRHTAGAVVVKELHLGGTHASADGIYEISGDGELTAEIVMIEDGQLRILGPAPNVTVSDLLYIRPEGFIRTSAGEIHMAGADLRNRADYHTLPSWDPVAYEDVALIFEGGRDVVSDFEVSAPDDPSRTHLPVLRRLQLGGAGPGRIRLVDHFDNWAGVDGEEALFVGNLILHAGAGVDLNGLSLYYYNGGNLKRLIHGDTNLDGGVDIFDLAALANTYGQPDADWAGGDFNGDGLVDVLDLAMLANNYRYATGAASGSTGLTTGGSTGLTTGGRPVPEPAALILLCGAAAPLLRKRSRSR